MAVIAAVSVRAVVDVRVDEIVSVLVIVVVIGEVRAAEDTAEVGSGGGGLLFREPTANAMITRDMPQNHATKNASR